MNTETTHSFNLSRCPIRIAANSCAGVQGLTSFVDFQLVKVLREIGVAGLTLAVHLVIKDLFLK